MTQVGYNYLREIKHELEDRWTPDIATRPYDQTINGFYYSIPDITQDYFDVVLENEDKQSELSSLKEYVLIGDSEGLTKTPQSIGYNEQKVEAAGVVRVRSALKEFNGSPVRTRSRVFGFYNDTGSSVDTQDQNNNVDGTIETKEYSRWAGMIGEVDRVFNEFNAGNKNWDVVILDDFDDISDNMPFGIHAAEARIGFIRHAEPIDTTK